MNRHTALVTGVFVSATFVAGPTLPASSVATPGTEVVEVSSDKAHCSGVRIGEYSVLTARHCVGRPGSEVKVSDVRGKVADVHRSRDVAVLCVAPLKSAQAGIAAFRPSPGAQAEIAGVEGGFWHDTRAVQSSSKTTFTVAAALPGAKPRRPCNGDSGGPAYVGGRVAGVAKKLDPPFNCGGRAEYTDVTEIAEWLANAGSCTAFAKILKTPQ